MAGSRVDRRREEVVGDVAIALLRATCGRQMRRATSHPGENTALRQQTIVGQQPQAIDFVDWQCRLTFKSRELVVRHFLERLELASDSAHGRAVADYLDYRLGPGGEEARIVCAKRSAVLRWRF